MDTLTGAYIPGHGTPTTLLFGRDREPTSGTVRVVMGAKGEPSRPDEASKGLVWSAIVGQVDAQGSETDWVSVDDVERETLRKHPWSIGGGGAAQLKVSVENAGVSTLRGCVESLGIMTVTGEDEAFVFPSALVRRARHKRRPFVEGDSLRDWAEGSKLEILFPYRVSAEVVGVLGESSMDGVVQSLWSQRARLRKRVYFGKVPEDVGMSWYELRYVSANFIAADCLIAFAEVATHNHFVLDRGGKVFKQTAPVIKLPADATEADHLALLGLLNSSTACFWMKQVFHNKGSRGTGGGICDETWERHYQLAGTGLKRFPIPEYKPLELATKLDRLATERQAHLPAQLVSVSSLPRTELDTQRAEAESIFHRMIALQEELDWRCYTLYDVTDDDLTYASAVQRSDAESADDVPGIHLGERAFEIVMARRMARDELTTTWFERHGSTPVTELPERWPADYRALVERRIALIESDRNIGLVEQPEYKRRWNQEPWDKQEQRALRGWLLDRLETPRYWPDVALQSTRALAERAQTDHDFRAVAELYTGRPDFSADKLVADLVASESAPFLAALRYKPSGLRKRADWQQTWERQREEDRIDSKVAEELTREDRETDEEYAERLAAEQRARHRREVGDIPAPPKYRTPDFVDTTVWRLRGPLDVPKERFVGYPCCTPDDETSLVVGWAGWDHRQQAIALVGHYTTLVEQHGWPAERLRPVLAGLRELIPWIRQWHNDIDPDFDVRMGDYFAEYLAAELQKHGLTDADLAAWEPPAKRARGKKSAGRRKVA